MFQKEIQKAVKVLKDGGIILYPTDTIWGIGCDSSNPEAIKRVYEIKKREDAKSLIVLVDSINMAERYVEEIPEIAYKLIELTTTPLTVIFPQAKLLPENLVNKDGSIAMRVPSDDFANELVFKFRRPIISTSANVAGEPSPANFNEISEEIKSAVDYIVDYRQDDLTKHKASGIIKLGPTGEIQVIRE